MQVEHTKHLFELNIKCSSVRGTQSMDYVIEVLDEYIRAEDVENYLDFLCKPGGLLGHQLFY